MTCSYMDGWRNYAPTVLRLATGIIFALHGWQKLEGGLPGVAGFVGSLGFPMPELFAVLLIAAELGGGILLILGLLTRWAAKALVVVSLVALFLVHLPNGFYMATGGYEYILLLLAASVSLMLTGGGKWSLDRMLWKK
ncbi:MAG: DoxX family protein [Patescibacteria group bacterium]